MRNRIFTFMLSFLAVSAAWAQSRELLLLGNWKFHKGAVVGAEAADFNDSKWEAVDIPHDWAISGPFDKEIDKQTVAIVQNGEKIPSEKTGRSGALPWIGEGWYRTLFEVPEGYSHATLVFDGAMSEPRVFVNGREAGYWAYGYNCFEIDITPYINKDGRKNTLAVHLKNMAESSRWYPGAGLYRPVRLVLGQDIGIKTWGTFVRTTDLRPSVARVTATTELRGAEKLAKGRKLYVRHTVLDAAGRKVAERRTDVSDSKEALSVLEVKQPRMWSPETPVLYTLLAEVCEGEKVWDTQAVRFGIRTAEVSAEGFKLNGTVRKIKGVCLHHDLGPLGAAFNKAAFVRQVKLLKGMGCDAIRTAHNMPAPWQMDICDSLGVMVMAESFDMWVYPKCKNGYSRFFEEWWKRDVTNLIRCHRNHPSIVMWSIGNEIPDQGNATGLYYTRCMQELCHSLDPTRTVTQGFDRVDAAIRSGVMQAMDVPGLNYRLNKYKKAYENSPHGLILGSETTSTVSSRGVYKLPVAERKSYAYDDGQCSGYDMESCSWSNLPDDDFAMQQDMPWVIGEFVWTGFDYLGEPSPYDNYWPSRSSYFGIFDLAGLPKDRYYLYRSVWNPSVETLHLLPHWTWPGHEGDTIPVYCYTNHPSAELFVNGKSQGRIYKDKNSRLDRFRLRWMNVVYEPGELKVVAYDSQGKVAGEKTVRTAGRPHHLELQVDRSTLIKTAADKQTTPDLAFVTVRVVDKDGNLCPDADPQLLFTVEGAAIFRACCNGDATSLEVFTRPAMGAFHGELVVVVEAGTEAGTATLKVASRGLKGAETVLKVK